MSTLHGLHIALTRPAGQVDALMSRIQAAGGEVLALPLLAIAPPSNPAHADGLRAQLAQADAVIFISICRLDKRSASGKLLSCMTWVSRAVDALCLSVLRHHVPHPACGLNLMAVLGLPAKKRTLQPSRASPLSYHVSCSMRAGLIAPAGSLGRWGISTRGACGQRH